MNLLSKKKKIYISYLFLFCGILSITALESTGQTNAFSIVEKQFDDYRKSNLGEKIFVHTDKNFYLAGDILWFKVYDVDATFHHPFKLSSVAYVEIIDDNNNPSLQTKITLKNGFGNGSINLPVTIKSGKYKFREYTSWMKNFSPDFFFEKIITIVNSQQSPLLPASKSVKKYDVQFFPEGGNLVNDIESKIAFKVIDNYGNSAACKGEIKDDNNKKIAVFESLKFGTGNFKLTPEDGRIYTATITMPDGSMLSAKLPQAYKEGYVVNSVETADGKFNVTVKTNSATINSSQTVYLFLHTRQSIKASMTGHLQNGVASFTIDKDVPGEGISHVTIFNDKRKPVCERLIFKYPKKIDLSVTTDQPVYDTRKKISMNINSTDNEGKAIAADMSIAVYKLDSIQLFDEPAITDYIWLRSDLKGNIESPGYYFNNVNDTVKLALDNLLLTQGWSRFKWGDVLGNVKRDFTFIPEINGHIINGKVVNNKSGQPAPNITGYLTVPGARPQFKTAVSDENGNIKFRLKEFYGANGIIVQTNPAEDTAYHIEINAAFSNQYTVTQLPDFFAPVTNPETLLENSIASQVQNIYATKKINPVINLSNDSLPFYYYASESYLLDNYTRFTTIEEIFREYVPYVNVRKRDGQFHLPLYNDITATGSFEKDPLVLLDGLPIFNLDKLMAYDALKVRKIDLVTRKYFYGNTTFNGIINFETYKGDLEGYQLDPQVIVLDYEALQLQREFYSPSYETPDQITGHKPDFRTLLQWSPNINTSLQGKAQISFYSSDLTGKYVGIVQGISRDGNTGSGVVFFEVK